MTDQSNSVYCEDIGGDFGIAAGSTIIHILIVSNNVEMMQWVLKHMDDKDNGE